MGVYRQRPATRLVSGGLAPFVGSSDVTIALTGVSGTGAVGTLAPASDKALTQDAATGSTGTLSPATSVAASQVAGSGATGNATPNSTLALTQASGSGAVGNVSAGGDVTVALTQVSGTGAIGSLAPAVSPALTQSSGSGAVGAVSPQASKAITGTSGVGAIGSAAPSLSLALISSGATGAVGTVSVGGDITVALTSVSGTGSAGTLVASKSIGLAGNITGAFAGNVSTTAQPLRAVTTQNQVFQSNESRAGKTRQITRWPFYVGSDDVAEFIFSFVGWHLGTSAFGNAPVALTIEKFAIEKGDGSASAPVTFSGGRSRTIAPGDNDIQSDKFFPSTFGLTKFSRDEKYWLRLEVSVPTAGSAIEYGARSTSGITGASCGWFDPATTTLTNGVDGTGAYTVTGTALDVRTNGYYPIILGRFVSGEPKTIFCQGDSIEYGQGDTGSTIHGSGQFQRSISETDGSLGIASINFSRIGVSANAVNGDARYIYWSRYCRYAIDELGTNDIGATGTGSTSLLETNLSSLYSAMRANGVQKIFRDRLFPRTSSTDSWATAANQTYNTEWTSAGKAGTINAWFDARLSDSTIDGILEYTGMRDASGPDAYKWISNGTANYATTDGTHPTTAFHLVGAADKRALWATLPNGSSTVAITGASAVCSIGSVAPSSAIALSGVSGTGTCGNVSAGNDVTVALTAVSGVGNVGTITWSGSISLIGSISAPSVGTVGPTNTIGITQDACAASIGALSSASAPTLTGASATVAAGSVSPSNALALSQDAGSAAIGTVAASTAVALTGAPSAGSVGTVSAGNNVVVAISGVSGVGAVGTIAQSRTVALTESAGTGVVGSAVPASAVAISQDAAAGSVGTVGHSNVVPLTGAAVAGAVGTVTAPGNVTVALTGNAAAAAVGTVGPALAVGATGNAAAVAVGTAGRITAVGITGNAVAVLVGNVTKTNSGTVALSGMSAVGSVGFVAIPAAFIPGNGNIFEVGARGRVFNPEARIRYFSVSARSRVFKASEK